MDDDRPGIPRQCGNCHHEWRELPGAGMKELGRCPRCNPPRRSEAVPGQQVPPGGAPIQWQE